MSLLDNQSSIEIKLYYKYVETEQGRRLTIVDDDKAKKLLEDHEESKNINVLETGWNLLTWKDQNEVLDRASKLNTKTGESQFDFVGYRDIIIKKCLKT